MCGHIFVTPTRAEFLGGIKDKKGKERYEKRQNINEKNVAGPP